MTFIEGGESDLLWRTVSTFNSFMMQSYLIGFVVTFSISDGIMRYFIIFLMQLNGSPIFGILEALGAFRAMTRSEAYMGFHVVQKEIGGKSSSGLAPLEAKACLDKIDTNPTVKTNDENADTSSTNSVSGQESETDSNPAS